MSFISLLLKILSSSNTVRGMASSAQNTTSIALVGSPFHYGSWLHLLPKGFVSSISGFGPVNNLDPDHPVVQFVVGLLLGAKHGCFDSGGSTGNPRIKLDTGYNLHGLVCIIMFISVLVAYRLHTTGCFTMARNIYTGIGNSGLEFVYYSLSVNSGRNLFFKSLIGVFITSNPSGRGWLKVIPDNIQSFLSPLTLAIWFIGDGELAERGRVINYCSQGFSQADNLKLSTALNSRYGLNTVVMSEININQKKTGVKAYYYYIRINPTDLAAFVAIILPHLPESAYYKLPEHLRP